MKFTTLLACITLISPSLFAAEPTPLKNEGEAKWGWFAFGHGIQDSGVNKSEDCYWAAVDWGATSWGNGMFYKFEAPKDLTGFKKVTFKANSTGPTQAKIHVQLKTADGAVFGTPEDTGFSLKPGQDTLIEADFASMVPIQAEQGQRAFQNPADLKAVDQVLILFMKPPDASEGKNLLQFKEMKLLP
jgi:hypothetical protein